MDINQARLIKSQDLIAQFDLNKNGKLDFEELKAYYKSSALFEDASDESITKDLKGFDADGDGLLDINELAARLAAIDKNEDQEISVEEAQNFKAQYNPEVYDDKITKISKTNLSERDTDKDNGINFDEFKAWDMALGNYSNNYSLNNDLRAHDKDNNGKLELEELKERYKEIDTDQDANISAEESNIFLRRYNIHHSPVDLRHMNIINRICNDELDTKDTDKDGKISLNELKEYYKAAGLDSSDKSIENDFKAHDKNNDGFIDIDEYIERFKETDSDQNARISDEEKKAFLDKYRIAEPTYDEKIEKKIKEDTLSKDANNDGKMDLSEFKVWYHSVSPNASDATIANDFKKHDINKDGYLDLNELKERYKGIDTNLDGEISAEESNVFSEKVKDKKAEELLTKPGKYTNTIFGILNIVEALKNAKKKIKSLEGNNSVKDFNNENASRIDKLFNKNGKIDALELLGFQLFADKNLDGKLSKKELEKANESLGTVQGRIRMLKVLRELKYIFGT